MTVRIINADVMDELFDTKTEAYKAGQKTARAKLYDMILQELAHVSVTHEKSGDVSAFRTAEQCCEVVRLLRQKTELH